jgi:hypothetical protein
MEFYSKMNKEGKVSGSVNINDLFSSRKYNIRDRNRQQILE